MPDAIIAADMPVSSKPGGYPGPFRARVAGLVKRPLGDVFGLANLGVNLTRLPPGAMTALHHRHSREDEFVYVLEGEPTLVTDGGETRLRPGMAAGFPAGGTAHHLKNETQVDCVLLEMGDRTQGDAVEYPRDDLKLESNGDYTRKDGTTIER